MSHNSQYRRILNRMGYYNYQRGLIFHHLEEEGSWNTHLKNCRDFILKSLDTCKPAIVTVLGSGWLLDLPLREIADQVTEVNLVDIVHPPEVRTQVSGMKNVVLREEDVSGGLILEVWNKAGGRFFFNKLRSLVDIKVPVYQPQFETGMVVSLNILTQLESLPVELLKKKSKARDEGLLNFRKEIQENHLQFLKKHESVIITDVSEVITGNSGKVNEISSVLEELPAGRERKEWTWNFDFRNSDFYRKKSVFRVAAILL